MGNYKSGVPRFAQRYRDIATAENKVGFARGNCARQLALDFDENTERTTHFTPLSAKRLEDANREKVRELQERAVILAETAPGLHRTAWESGLDKTMPALWRALCDTVTACAIYTRTANTDGKRTTFFDTERLTLALMELAPRIKKHLQNCLLTELGLTENPLLNKTLEIWGAFCNPYALNSLA